MIKQLCPEYCCWNTWRNESMDTCDAFYVAWRFPWFTFSFYIQFNPLHRWYYKRWFVKPRCYPIAFGKVYDLKFELPSCEFEFSFIKWDIRQINER